MNLIYKFRSIASLGGLMLITMMSFGQVISISNPDFTGPCNNCSWASVVAGWTNCAGGTSDGLPGCWGVNGPAQSGSTYIGLLPGEALSQNLPAPILAGVDYKMTIWLSHDPNFSISQVPLSNTGCSSTGASGTQGAAGTMQIWGGNVSCGKTELLYQSPPVSWTVWTQLTITLTPAANYNFFTITEAVTGNIIMDNMSPSITVLPIQLASFKALSKGSSVVLDWSTSSEENNQKFVIERSIDGVTFESIGEMLGAGNSTVRNDYRYVDAKPLRGCAYYRLKQVDFDEEATYSRIASVAEVLNSSLQNLFVTSQPVGNSAQLEFNSINETDVLINIVDATGRMLSSKETHVVEGIQTVDINTSNLSKGLYFLTLSYDGKVQQTKFLKE